MIVTKYLEQSYWNENNISWKINQLVELTVSTHSGAKLAIVAKTDLSLEETLDYWDCLLALAGDS